MKLESPRKASASTPGKLRRQALEDCMFDTSRELTYPVGSALLKDRLMVKHPGAKEPLWPNKEQVHVRGLSEASRPKWDWHARGKRKQKQFRQFVDSSESVLDNFTASLQPEPESVQRPDGFDEPRHDLRLPEKHLISGQDVATHVLSQLCAPLRSLDEDDLVEKPNKRARVHPSIAKLYNDIPDHLSAFDHCKGESQGWTLKHAPTTAGEVLQSNVKMTALKTWLQSLTINTVEAVPSTKPAGKSAAKPKKKRQRPVDDLNDFLVDDDVGVHEMSFLPDFAELEEPSSKHQPKSIVQTSNGSKFSNAVLLSGPHGCGKTASAYAVAKELGFQIFEISSAERRSGRDVIDKVGDMTENHIVRHHGTDAGESSASEDPTHMDAAFQKDLESGRQGKMSAFFKKQPTTKPAAKAAPAHKSQPQKTQTLETLQKALKQPVKDQQQSLILLEEVDILFKEDKDFWTTVFKLLATSKRPFIMTCNDEDLVPLGAMTLHAVLRFAPPPVDSAVDLMLLMAALEGHLLKREPVISLFEYKSRDLRASIAELDFWCQMGVGDPKGGLSWIYQRYPPGSDVDEHGRKLRVISENTFQDGMGLMQPDVKVDDDAVLLALREFGVEPTSLFDWQTTDEGHAQTGVSSLSLRDMGKLSDSLSAADTYTTHITVDASLPEMSAKARTHYTENMALLESNEKIDYSDMFEKLAVSSTLLSCRAFCPSEVAENVLSSSNLLRSIRTAASGDDQALTRRDFACFDAISVPSGGSTTSGSLELSAFDGPLPAITTDLAPYVRSIAQYDLSLEEQRRQLNDLLGEGHKPKRARTTRAARSALEGSQRGSTRRERWFPEDLDLDATLATGGKGWPKTVAEAKDVEMAESGEAPASSVGSAG